MWRTRRDLAGDKMRRAWAVAGRPALGHAGPATSTSCRHVAIEPASSAEKDQDFDVGIDEKWKDCRG
jgi:hypothetical protein